MEPLKPYFVIDDVGDSYHVSSHQEDVGFSGYVLKTDVVEWNTREGLHFVESTFEQDVRSVLEAWKSEDAIRRYSLKYGEMNLEQLDQSDIGPTYGEELQTRAAGRRILPYPLLETKTIPGSGGIFRRIHHVLIPANVTRAVTDLTIEGAREVAGAVTICVVFDASRSMRLYAKTFVKTLELTLGNYDPRMRIAVGFILFRNPGGRISQRFELVHPMPVRDAVDWLDLRVRRLFGGDDSLEPVLDAVALAHTSFPWNSGSAIRGARRLVILVAHDDARLETVGFGTTVPKGLNAVEVAGLLGIPVYAMQAGRRDGGSLVDVLLDLATKTGGEFYPAPNRPEETRRVFSTDLAAILDRSVIEGIAAAGQLEPELFDSRHEGGTVIALDVLDQSTRERLEAAAFEFNISEGGLVVTDAWVFDAPELYREKILIEKEVLQKLVNFFSGLTDFTLSGPKLRDSTAQLLRALIGENLEEGAELQELLEKRLGIHFRTNFLDFELEYLEALREDSVELELLRERIESSTNALADFLVMNARHFNKEPRIWMPVNYLP